MNTATAENKIMYTINAQNFSKIPGSPIAYWASGQILKAFSDNVTLGEISRPRVGQNTGDNNRFLRFWHEVSENDITYGLAHDAMTTQEYKWIPYNKGGEYRKWYGNQEYIINWYKDGKEIKEYAVIRNHGKHWSRYIQNVENMCKAGITWSFVTTASFAVRFLPQGFICDVAGSAIFPDVNYLIPLTALCNSKIVATILNIINPTINMQAGNVASIPVDTSIVERSVIIELTKQNISISKNDWDSFETSWDFKKHPLI